jgi:hypothetical protein
MTNTLTKQDKVLNYLSRGRTLSQESAYNMFGVGNLRATISDIKETAHKMGFLVARTTGRHGETRYGFTSRPKRSRR